MDDYLFGPWRWFDPYNCTRSLELLPYIVVHAVPIPERPLGDSIKMTHTDTHVTHTKVSTELLDYIQAIKPSLGDEMRGKTGLMVIHYITLASVSGGRAELQNTLAMSDDSFVRKVPRNTSLVPRLAFALKLDLSCIYDGSPVPEGLRRQCRLYHIDVEARIRRNKKIEDAREVMWDLVKAALAVMAALHDDMLGCRDK